MTGTLAPPFTPENAGDMARKATISRESNRKLKKELQQAIERASQPIDAQAKAAKQVEKVLAWMDKEKDRTKFAQLAACLDRLWNKAFPTQAPIRGGRRSRGSLRLEPVETPQGETQQFKDSAENQSNQQLPPASNQ